MYFIQQKIMLSKASKHAVRGVLYLQYFASKDLKISAKQVAEELEIPAPFLSKILQKLTKKRIISSIKGPFGGFYLSKADEKNTLLDIIACVDGIDKFNDCFLGQLECNEENPCVVHHLYAPFKNELLKKLKNKTILELAKEYAINNNLSKKIE